MEPRPDIIGDEYMFSRLYETEDGKSVDFTIDYMHYGGRIYIMPEEGETLQLEELVINGHRADLYYDSVSSVLLVHDEQHGIEIDICSNI